MSQDFDPEAAPRPFLLRALPYLFLALLVFMNTFFCIASILPQWNSYQGLAQTAEFIHEQLTVTAVQATAEDSMTLMRRQLERLQEQRQSISLVFFSAEQVEALIARLYDYANLSQVSIKTLLSQPQSAGAGTSVPYGERLLRLELEGTVGQLMNYVARLDETMLASLSVNSFSLQSGANSDRLTLELRLYTSDFAPSTLHLTPRPSVTAMMTPSITPTMTPSQMPLWSMTVTAYWLTASPAVVTPPTFQTPSATASPSTNTGGQSSGANTSGNNNPPPPTSPPQIVVVTQIQVQVQTQNVPVIITATVPSATPTIPTPTPTVPSATPTVPTPTPTAETTAEVTAEVSPPVAP